jgi:hypothetical protein
LDFLKVRRVRLKAMGLPDALHRAQADAGGLGDGASGPMRGVAGWLRARQREDPRHSLWLQRRLAWLAALITQQPVHPLLSIALLPAPYRRTADKRPAAPQ